MMDLWNADLEELYQELCRTPSDINESLPTLRKYAVRCGHVTEFGIGGANSTCALLAAQPDALVSYDLHVHLRYLENLHRVRGRTEFQWHQANVLQITIAPTDMLFIDTVHTYVQLKEELRLHAEKAGKYLAFHDTWIYGERDGGETGHPIKGLRPALEEFLGADPRWKVLEDHQTGSGLMVLGCEP